MLFFIKNAYILDTNNDSFQTKSSYNLKYAEIYLHNSAPKNFGAPLFGFEKLVCDNISLWSVLLYALNAVYAARLCLISLTDCNNLAVSSF